MGKKVFIMSIPRETATGVSNARGESGAKINKSKIWKSNTKIQPLYSPNRGGLNNYISYTPWIDPATNLPAKNAEGKQIMLQEYLENKYGKPSGYYTNMAPRKDQKPEDNTYFQSTYWILNDGTTVFDLDNEHDEVGYYVMLGSHLVANSEREYKEHKWPKAEFYIALENESDDLRYKRNQIKSKAFASLEDSTFSETFRRKFVVLLNLTSSRTVLTIEQVNNLLFDYIDKSSFTEGSNINKFNSIFSLLKTAPGRENLEARYLLQQALDNRIVYEKQGTYVWVRAKGNITLGERYEDAVEFLTNPKKSAELEEIQEEVKKKLI